MSAPTVQPVTAFDPETICPPEARPSVVHLVTEDEALTASMYAERQEQLLIDPLYASWAGPGEDRTFIALANVGLFSSDKGKEPPVVPDALLSLDVHLPPHLREKRCRSYFIWEFDKPPDVCLEVISNLVGEELGKKLRKYAQLGVAYYVVWDPLEFLGKERLRVFVLRGRSYEPLAPAWFPEIGLGLGIWHGKFRDIEEDWLRWVDGKSQFLSTGTERAEQERQRAEQERQRAEQERQRAEKMAAQLRALGIEPPP